MAEEILISRTFAQIRVALMIDGVAAEIWAEQASDASLVGGIYLGTVVRIVPSLQAAFVDIGREKMGFLHLRDLPKIKSAKPIEQRLHQGERLIVQVAKDETLTKGATLTANIALTSPYLVYRPYDVAEVRTSARLAKTDRARLKHIFQNFIKSSNIKGSIIVRTNAKNIDEKLLIKNAENIINKWQNITKSATTAKLNKAKFTLLDKAPSIIERSLTELVNEHTERIVVDDMEVYDLVKSAESFGGNIELYQNDKHRTMFDAYGVEAALDRALSRQIDLPSGGSIVIEHTEAMTTIDVNTGAFIDRHADDKAIYQTNKEAALEIARQIRLRNLGGIIVIDFINMVSASHQEMILDILAAAIKNDRIQTILTGMNELGLVTLTRHRTQSSLAQQLCAPCEACQGRGFTKKSDTVAFDIIRKLLGVKNTERHAKITAHASVVDYLHTHERQTIENLEQLLGTKIMLQTGQECQPDAYQIAFFE